MSSYLMMDGKARIDHFSIIYQLKETLSFLLFPANCRITQKNSFARIDA